MVREGNEENFEKCCHYVWQWILNVKQNKEKVNIIMEFAPKKADDEQRSTDESDAGLSPTEKLFFQFKQKTEACLDGGDFGELRTDHLAGSLIQPSKLALAHVAIFIVYKVFQFN